MAEIEVNNLKEAQEKLAELSETTDLNKPSPEEVEIAKNEFEEKSGEFNTKMFKLGDPEEADKIAKFMIEFLEKYVYWTKNGWMGVLKLHAEITEFIKTKKDGDSFALGYQALEFIFFVLSNPGGSGIASARAIEKVADIYAKVIEYSGTELEAAREELKSVQFLQEKWNAMVQGFYLEREDGVEEEKDQFAAPTAEDLLAGE